MQGNRWYPSKDQLSSPEMLERSFRQLLSQHYELQDKFDAMAATASPASASPTAIGKPPGGD
jgi:hypothetical protein